MTDEPTAADGTENDMAEHLAAIAAQSQRMAARLLSGQDAAGAGSSADPLNLSDAFMAMARSLAADPSPLIDAQMKWWDGYLRLWQQGAQRLQGEAPSEPIIEPEPDDRRFRDPAWTENWAFDHLKQSYLLTAACVQSAVGDIQGLEERDAAKLAFYSRQFVDALAPTNFLATNPAALRETVETKGENLLRGLRNVLDDLERNDGRFAPRMSDEGHFTLGETVATTPGTVVFQNDLMQLIQYAPGTETVYRRPLLIVPPWINKYYVLDLRPKNSFVRWAVSKGYTVFLISWVNPDERLAEKTFEDYMLEGPLAALDAIAEATGERDVAPIGYCLGGTLTAATLAYLAARGDERIKSATFFASLVDFAEPGELGVFIDDAQIESLDAMMAEKGYLDGRHMATTFNMLRANDLIWSFVVNNYLLGREPMPFDLLFWNSDSTRMPAAMHGYYLRKMYRENLLAQPGGLSLAGVPIDLRVSTSRPISWRRGRITSRRGSPASPRAGSMGGGAASCSVPPAISPASSIRPRPENTATGPGRSWSRRVPTPGSPPPSATRVPGGTTGTHGSAAVPAATRCRRVFPAQARSSRSRTRRAPTCWRGEPQGPAAAGPTRHGTRRLC